MRRSLVEQNSAIPIDEPEILACFWVGLRACQYKDEASYAFLALSSISHTLSDVLHPAGILIPLIIAVETLTRPERFKCGITTTFATYRSM